MQSGSLTNVATAADQLANVPRELQEGSRFVCWREESRNRKPTKVPINPHTGNEAESDNPVTWSTLAEDEVNVTMRDDEARGIMASPQFTAMPRRHKSYPGRATCLEPPERIKTFCSMGDIAQLRA
jgi:hypothetical protein